MAFVTTLHLQASADTALSCKPVQPVTKGARAFPSLSRLFGRPISQISFKIKNKNKFDIFKMRRESKLLIEI